MSIDLSQEEYERLRALHPDEDFSDLIERIILEHIYEDEWEED